MTAIFYRERRWIIAIVNVLHLPLLLLPTLLIGGMTAIDVESTILACGIFAASLLESLSIRARPLTAIRSTQDQPAMRVALIVGISLLLLLWAAQIERCWSRVTSPTLLGCGLLLMMVGVSLRIAAIRALGEQFISDIRREGEIIQTGIYSWLRHPSEIGLLLIAAASPLVVGAPRTSAVAVVLLTPISLWRMHRENVALSLTRRIEHSSG